MLCSMNRVHVNQNRIRELVESSRVLLAYLWLELNEPNQVMNLAKLTLKEDPILCGNDNTDCVFSLRRRATMRMYASEALSILGIPSSDDLTILNENDANINAIIHNSNVMATCISAIKSTNHQQFNDVEIKRLENATTSIQISSAMSKLSLGDVDSAIGLSQHFCRKLASETYVNDLKHDGFATLIQSLICSGRVVEAAQLAKTLS